MNAVFSRIPEHDGSHADGKRALRAWLRQLRSLPRLTHDEEKALIVEAQHDISSPAAATIIERHTYLAVLVALDFQFARYDPFDMVSDGIEGLMTALQRFEVDRGWRFSTYAKFWVRARISDAVATHHGALRFGTSRGHRKVLRNIGRLDRQLRKQGLVPTDALIARALSVKEEEVTTARIYLTVPSVSAESPIGVEEGFAWIDTAADDSPNSEMLVADAEEHALRKSLFNEFADTLSEREQLLWFERMVSDEPRSTPDIAEQLGVSRQRVSQVEGAVRQKLRRYVERSGTQELVA
ncbi:MAG: RNA polymerase sigma-32 factor [Bradymonadia bacterium]|jgi:RNA polymerase sigma-32 factor